MTKKIVTDVMKTHFIDQMIESITEESNTIYYSFAGDHISKGMTEEEVSVPNSSYKNLKLETFRNMIFGKKIVPNDMMFMIKKIEWEADTVYEMYDDENIDLRNRKFYVMVDEESYKHVYKCLYNGNYAFSTVKPLYNDIVYNMESYNLEDTYYETSDGYQWRYMYSIPSYIYEKFATQDYIPVLPNPTVERNAIPGTIDVIVVEENGKNYNNYYSGQFSTRDIDSGNTVQFRLSGNASPVRDFYANTIIYLTGGTGSGQYRRVTKSYVFNSSPHIELNESFETKPDSTTTFEISPEVRVISDGKQTVNVVARAIVNANAGNSIYKVETLMVGQGYNYATASILNGAPGANDNTDNGEIILPSRAYVRPIISPESGHGANTVVELFSNVLCIRSKFIDNENGKIPTHNSFAQFGIIRDPLFSNVHIGIENEKSFVNGEIVVQHKKIALSSNVAIANSMIYIDNFHYESIVPNKDSVLIQNNVDITKNFVSKLVSANASTITIEDECHWSSNNCSLYFVHETARGIVNRTELNELGQRVLSIDKCTPSFSLSRPIIGLSSFVSSNTLSIDINNRYQGTYNFDLFNQVLTIEGSLSGVTNFTENEMVVQSQTGSYGYVYFSNSSVLQLTSTIGNFDPDYPIIGNQSSAVMEPDFHKYFGDLDPTSGSIIYLQNDIPVSRSNTQSEEIKILLEF